MRILLRHISTLCQVQNLLLPSIGLFVQWQGWMIWWALHIYLLHLSPSYFVQICARKAVDNSDLSQNNVNLLDWFIDSLTLRLGAIGNIFPAFLNTDRDIWRAIRWSKEGPIKKLRANILPWPCFLLMPPFPGSSMPFRNLFQTSKLEPVFNIFSWTRASKTVICRFPSLFIHSGTQYNLSDPYSFLGAKVVRLRQIARMGDGENHGFPSTGYQSDKDSLQ